jgi:hypothetical chaperone protein
MRRGVGLDFGTTNSAIALATEGGRTVLARVAAPEGLSHAFRSLLYFYLEEPPTPQRPASLAGPAGIARYLEDEEPGRLRRRSGPPRWPGRPALPATSRTRSRAG